jgi:hypothetical protein
MALAYLEVLDASPGGIELLADIGTNVYYQYQIGSASSDVELDRIDFESPLEKYEQGAFGPPLRLRLPASRLPRGSRHLQLVSYRDPQRNGPAWSRVVVLHPLGVAGVPDEWSDPMNLRRRPRATPFEIPPASPARASAVAPPPVAPTASVRIAVPEGATFDVLRERVAVFQPASGMGVVTQVTAVVGQVPRAIAQATLREPASGATLASVETRLTEVRAGTSVTLFFDSAQLANAPRQTRLLVDVTLRWPTGAGVQRARASVPILLADGSFVAAVSDDGDRSLVADDPERHRAFWHRIWAWRVPTESQAIRWELDLACRYGLQASSAQATNGRLETRALVDSAPLDDLTYEVAGKLKSGLEMALDELNGLLGDASLSGEQLAAVKASPTCVAKLSACAETRLRAKGKRANEMVIWAVPSFEARVVTLRMVAATDENGRVTNAEAAERAFPFPAKVRFVTLRSTDQVDESAPFPGFEIAADVAASVEAIA